MPTERLDLRLFWVPPLLGLPRSTYLPETFQIYFSYQSYSLPLGLNLTHNVRSVKSHQFPILLSFGVVFLFKMFGTLNVGHGLSFAQLTFGFQQNKSLTNRYLDFLQSQLFHVFFVTSCMYTESSKGEMFKVEDSKNKKECVHFVPISGAQNISKLSK